MRNISPQDIAFNNDLQGSLIQQNSLLSQKANNDYIMNEQQKSLTQEQLDLGEELERIQNLLHGRVIIINREGVSEWRDPPNKDDVLLSEAGINLVLNSIQWYLNKNTLLSNYDEETILSKMEDFATTLADVLFMKYEKYFLYPSPEECQEKLIDRLKKRLQEIRFTKELKGEDFDKTETWNNLVNEIDPTIERHKIREQIVKDKLKNYELLIRLITDSVHSAYLRALFGAERRTLRQHIHITENISPFIKTGQEEKSSLNPLNFLRRFFSSS